MAHLNEEELTEYSEPIVSILEEAGTLGLAEAIVKAADILKDHFECTAENIVEGIIDNLKKQPTK